MKIFITFGQSRVNRGKNTTPPLITPELWLYIDFLCKIIILTIASLKTLWKGRENRYIPI